MRLKSMFTLLSAFLLICLSGLAFADTNDVISAISSLCTGLTNLLPPAAMLMVLVGAVVYAAGQVMGAETRARANVWATASLTGALMGVLISAVAPSMLQTAYGDGVVSCSGAANPADDHAGPSIVPSETHTVGGGVYTISATASDPSEVATIKIYLCSPGCGGTFSLVKTCYGGSLCSYTSGGGTGAYSYHVDATDYSPNSNTATVSGSFSQ